VAICTSPLQYTRHIPDALFDRRVSLRAPRVRSSLLSVSQWQYSRSLITSLSAVTDLCEGRVNRLNFTAMISPDFWRLRALLIL